LNQNFTVEYKNFSFDENYLQQENALFNSSQPSEATATANHSNKIEDEEAFKEMFREKLQLKLFGSSNPIGGGESKKFQVNPAFKEALQKNFNLSSGYMFPFVDEGFSTINSKKAFKNMVHEEETEQLLEKEGQDAVVIKAERKKGDVLMKNE
jgi:hypothetical protein